MKTDKLKMKSDLITKYEDKNIDYIETTIALSKFEKFLYSKSTIFVYSLSIMLSILVYKVNTQGSKSIIIDGLILLLLHFVLYNTVITKLIFKNSEEDIKDLSLQIDTLSELVERKKTSDI